MAAAPTPPLTPARTQTTRRMLRAATVGFASGCLLGALYLFASAQKTTRPDCAVLTRQECAFEDERIAQAVRWRRAAGVALLLLGGAAFLLLPAAQPLPGQPSPSSPSGQHPNDEPPSRPSP